MTLRVVLAPRSPAVSPFRLLDEKGHEIAFVNAFLDALQIRLYSPRSIRIYAYDLLDFSRWWLPQNHASLQSLTHDSLADYVRAQLLQQPPPAATTINHRLTVIGALYRFHYHQDIPSPHAAIERSIPTRSPLGYGVHRRLFRSDLRLRQPRRIVVPLSAEDVSRFWATFHTFRDLLLIALMLYNGLRSCEILRLRLDHVHHAERQILILGKGDKPRILPLTSACLEALRHYLETERPSTTSPFLFVSLKGAHRGHPMTPAGLRSLFRYHRRTSRIRLANPHRFRHTFGHDMVCAGISLPALMHLMGHTQIRTTLLYVELSPQEVWGAFAQAVHHRAAAAREVQS
jgi:integrase/recombinase XerD